MRPEGAASAKPRAALGLALIGLSARTCDTLGGICNPAALNISICNAIIYYLFPLAYRYCF